MAIRCVDEVEVLHDISPAFGHVAKIVANSREHGWHGVQLPGDIKLAYFDAESNMQEISVEQLTKGKKVCVAFTRLCPATSTSGGKHLKGSCFVMRAAFAQTAALPMGHMVLESACMLVTDPPDLFKEVCIWFKPLFCGLAPKGPMEMAQNIHICDSSLVNCRDR